MSTTETVEKKNSLSTLAGKFTLLICGAALAVIGIKFSPDYKQYLRDKEELLFIRGMDVQCDNLTGSIAALEKVSPQTLYDKPIYWHCKARDYIQSELARKASL